MSLVARNEQQRLAQIAYDNLIPGESEIDLMEAANELLDDPSALHEIAANDLPFSMDGEWFTEATEALIKLDVKHPSDLMGSQLLTDLYRLAKTVRAAAMEVAREKVEDAS
ncbi:hypothetical protein [Stenotrophomonas sp. UBA7606]|uniref:hypothetical protein n=1 Tax=Stenotrophomonas sp. UBA7606 TaxID=1947559 RepID=UPI0025DA6920|nr:hypothetical protein [Stenotrophomonas sp. UBA7606]